MSESCFFKPILRSPVNTSIYDVQTGCRRGVFFRIYSWPFTEEFLVSAANKNELSSLWPDGTDGVPTFFDA